ncbi:hypothetical protein M2360_000921 [Rhizobium sp. SG_E_25_P2]|uniref:hypothetical protein n=1 Tax=Rhizobium sp. SG_E_25_P2 TaxID=2879942 RepID=UPI002476F249|nr:hypothetical protein [Rhizobium sp. SG_E_25_P2]MDH6265531.1 hypothetical protein [Rhizobium sp. SG_E_25_P2]
MKIKMLESMAGVGFALAIGEETDRFGDEEAKRIIKAGFAEKAAPPVVKKPATKAEWDAERETLLADRASEQEELAMLKEQQAALQARLDQLEGFHASVIASLPATAGVETTEAAAAPEIR